ncbi:MAG: hypothetical protein IID40_07350 [Planctomycetes bacterium]|nr:hypothetical protein [Planctomycetota bacterium]
MIWAVGGALVSATAPAVAGPPDSAKTVAVTDDHLQSLIDQLGDPSFEVRTRATRRLCMIGQQAAPALRRAARGDEFEIGLRARNLLEVIDSVYFGGCRITLSADKDRIAWDAPVALTVTIHNESAYRAHLPIDLDASRRRALNESARLVGDLLDVADYLVVTDPDGRRVELRVDDLRADPQVADAVEWRADGGPVEELAPGARTTIHLRPFNRGWARYPLLKRGRYRVVFDYHPEWDDAEFREAAVGRVVSNALTFEVTTEAPPFVRRARRPAALAVEREGAALVARLTNGDDLPIRVNLNFGADRAPFAQFVWTIVIGDSMTDLRLDLTTPPPPLAALSRDRLPELAPGDSLEVTRVDLARLIDVPSVQALPDGASFGVQAAWINQGDVVWQLQQDPSLVGNPRAPRALQTLLPRRMITGRFSSDAVKLTKSPPAPKAATERSPAGPGSGR